MSAVRTRIFRQPDVVVQVVAIEDFAHLGNAASQRVAERAGLTRGRVVRDYRTVKGVSWDVVFYGTLRP